MKKDVTTPVLCDVKVIHENPFYYIKYVDANFGSFSKQYYIAEYGGKSAVVIDNKGSILLVQQYRFIPNNMTWEIPGGGIEKNESAVEAAYRECFEESGIKCRDLQSLLSYDLGVDTISSRISIFYTKTFSDENAERNVAETSEICRRTWIPLSKCMDMIFNNEIVESSTILALFAYKEKFGKEVNS